MDWDAVRHPSGPLPPQVYWFRRLGLLAVLAAVLALVVVAVLSLGGGSGTQRVGQALGAPGRSSSPTVPGATDSALGPPGGAPAPATTGSSGTGPAVTSTASTGTPTTDAGQPCAPSALTLTLHTSADTYPAGVAPTFTATLRTTGAACSAPGPLAFTVASGPDRVWASSDCSPAAGAPTALPAAGAAGASRSWQRTRSSPGCVAVSGEPTAQAGTYRVTATWAGATSGEAVFHLR